MDFDFEDVDVLGGDVDNAEVGLFQDLDGQKQTVLGEWEPPKEVRAVVPLDDFELPNVEIVNVLASYDLDCEVDLRLVVISSRNCEYNPRKINAAILRLHRPARCTATIFQCGRVSITGLKTVPTLVSCAKTIGKVIKRAGHPHAKFRNFRIESVVARTQCGFPIRLEQMAADYPQFCHYEPEIFCGLVYRHAPAAPSGHTTPGTATPVGQAQNSPAKATVMIFVSGKLVINGCKTQQQAQQVFTQIFPLLAQYKPQDLPPPSESLT